MSQGREHPHQQSHLQVGLAASWGERGAVSPLGFEVHKRRNGMVRGKSPVSASC